jgi:hypothetical protein
MDIDRVAVSFGDAFVRGEKETSRTVSSANVCRFRGIQFPSRTHEWIFGETMVSV